MESTTTSTKTETSITQKGNKIFVKEVTTTTTTKTGQAPVVKVVEKSTVYDVKNLPPHIKLRGGDLISIDETCSRGLKDKKGINNAEDKDKKNSQGTSKARPAGAQKIGLIPLNAKQRATLNEQCLAAHNEYRKRHGVPPLTFSQKLADLAQEWADELAVTDKFEHRQNTQYGENLYFYYSSDSESVTDAKVACDIWYREISSYDFDREPTSMAAGHFTQMVWKESKTVGMALARSTLGKQVMVANYEPAGNIIGQFVANVPRPLTT